MPLVERRFKFAPPPWRVFDALVNEIEDWWSPDKNETALAVLSAERPKSVIYASPFVSRPRDNVTVNISTDGGYGAMLVLVQDGESPHDDALASQMRHRWGLHLGSHLREWLDHGDSLR